LEVQSLLSFVCAWPGLVLIESCLLHLSWAWEPSSALHSTRNCRVRLERRALLHDVNWNEIKVNKI
jgi:hypothetical protein